MGIIDWIILAVLLLFTFFGWRKGLLASIIQLGGYILTFFLVGHYYPLVQRSLILKFHFAKWLATVVSVVLIIVLIVVIVRIVIFLLEKFLRALKLSPVNRTLGAVRNYQRFAGSYYFNCSAGFYAQNFYTSKRWRKTSYLCRRKSCERRNLYKAETY